MVQRRTSGGKCPRCQLSMCVLRGRSRFRLPCDLVELWITPESMNPREQDTTPEPRGNFTEDKRICFAHWMAC